VIEVSPIIAMTTWPGRLSQARRTIENIHRVATGYPVVLTLSREEFPYGPPRTGADDVIMCDGNVGPFKKILYAMEQFYEHPVVSADDDAVYLVNFPELLHRKWKECGGEHRKLIVTNVPNVKTGGVKVPNGYCTFYPHGCLRGALDMMTSRIVETNNDDTYYGTILTARNYEFEYLHMVSKIATFVEDGLGLGENGMYRAGNADLEVIVSELRKRRDFVPMNELFKRKWICDG